MTRARLVLVSIVLAVAAAAVVAPCAARRAQNAKTIEDLEAQRVALRERWSGPEAGVR